MGKFINQNNMTKLGLEHLKSFATRGVIIDAVKVFQAGRQAQGQHRLQEAVPGQGHASSPPPISRPASRCTT